VLILSPWCFASLRSSRSPPRLVPRQPWNCYMLYLTTSDFKHVILNIEIIWNDCREELRFSIEQRVRCFALVLRIRAKLSNTPTILLLRSEGFIWHEKNGIQYLLDRLKIQTLYCFQSNLKPWLVTQTGNDLLTS
jgi:hypothetical protein